MPATAKARLRCLRSGADPALAWIEDAHPSRRRRRCSGSSTACAGYVAAARAGLADKPALFDALGRFRVLCAEREGPRGVVEVNAFVGRHFRRALDHALDPGARSEWYPGRPVMVLRNDYVLKLFNGDVGIVLPDASGTLMVYFPESDGGFRAVAPLRLPEHETAFATTVHKAQGSEFDQVAADAAREADARGDARARLHGGDAVALGGDDRRRGRGAAGGDRVAYAAVFRAGGAAG